MANKKNHDFDEVLLFKFLFEEFKKQAMQRVYIIFPPDKLDCTNMKKIRILEIGQAKDEIEGLKFLAATIYHKIVGQSEWNSAAYILDGYGSIDNKTSLWPLLKRMLDENNECSIEKVELAFDKIKKKKNSAINKFQYKPKKTEGWMTQEANYAIKKKGRLSKNDDRVLVLEKLSPNQRIKLLAILEKHEEQCRHSSGVYIEWAWAEKAIEAFKIGDFTNPLIHHFLSYKDISKVIEN